MGGAVLHHGAILEMKTGEGKTVSSVTAAYLNALTGRGVHIVTVNDYLVELQASLDGPGVRICSASRWARSWPTWTARAGARPTAAT